jgi:hypothetical protein
VGRTFLITVAVAALVATTAASATRGPHRLGAVVSSSTTELMPGVTYAREVEMTSSGPVVLDVVTAPQPDGTVYSLAPVLAKHTIGRTAKLTTIGKGLHAGATTIGVDGDYFNSLGQPYGILMQGGALENEPNAGRTSLGIAADGTLQAAKVAFYGTWQSVAGTRPLTLNSRRGRYTLFTPAFGSWTPAEAGPVAEAVFSSFPPAQASKDLKATVAQVASVGGTPIPPGGAVLVARGASYVTQLENEAPAGQKVTVRLTLTPDWSGEASAIGGGPLLVRNGKAVFSSGEAFKPGFLQSRLARGAVGQLADGRILLVTAEQTTSAYSAGLSSYDLALALVKLGAVTAVGLGSGPQAGMAFDGSLLTRPTSGAEQRISDALVLSYTGVYAAPVARVLSPNGDGTGDKETLSYRLVRPATVTAALNGPNGATVPVESGPEPVGTHTFVWDGNAQPEGAWTFSVSATDDRNVTTEAERTFSLDKTLRSLRVVRFRGRPAPRFVLTRQADVVIRIERPNGVAVATIHPQLGAGTWVLRVPWKAPKAGKYLMRVDATSTIGTSSLVVPFTRR